MDQARNFYEKLVAQFPNAGRYWKAYIEHELRAKNFENVEKVNDQSISAEFNDTVSAIQAMSDASTARGLVEMLRVLRA